MFSRIEHDTNPEDFVDVCNRLCTALGCSSIKAVELTSYQLTKVAYEWYKSLLRSRPVGSPTLDWPKFYNAFWNGLCLKVFGMPRHGNLNS